MFSDCLCCIIVWFVLWLCGLRVCVSGDAESQIRRWMASLIGEGKNSETKTIN